MKLMQTIHHYDVSIFTWVSQRKSQKILVRIARAISSSGNGPLYLVLAGMLYWMGGAEKMQLLTCMALALIIERPVYFVMKNACKRDRPSVTLNTKSFVIPSDRFSFPSGHTSAAFLMATLYGWYFPALLPALFTWATMVGMARVILGVHYPTDTAIGALMGISIALYSMGMILT